MIMIITASVAFAIFLIWFIIGPKRFNQFVKWMLKSDPPDLVMPEFPSVKKVVNKPIQMKSTLTHPHLGSSQNIFSEQSMQMLNQLSDEGLEEAYKYTVHMTNLFEKNLEDYKKMIEVIANIKEERQGKLTIN